MHSDLSPPQLFDRYESNRDLHHRYRTSGVFAHSLRRDLGPKLRLSNVVSEFGDDAAVSPRDR